MSKVQTLRVFVNQRLTAAAEEIFELFERTIAEYEEELQQQREAVFSLRAHRADVQQLLVSEEEVQQDWSPSLDQEDPPELPQVKEEQEELWTGQEGEQLHQNQTEENRAAEHLKTEADEEDFGGPEPARNFNPGSHLQPATHDRTSYSCEIQTDNSWDWETKEPKSGLNPLQNNEEPVSDQECGKTPVSSSDCATSFGQKGHQQEHNETQTGVKPFSCSVCGKRYPRKNSLTCHMRLHLEGKRFSCSVCKKPFQWRRDVVTHMRIHTGEKPFSCPVCGIRFARKEDVKRHLTVHTGERPFSCLVCGKRFARNTHLRRHSSVHRGEK